MTRYVIYRFAEGEKINLDDPTHIIKITSATTYKLPYKDDTRKYTYVVTALDRMQNESKGVKEKSDYNDLERHAHFLSPRHNILV